MKISAIAPWFGSKRTLAEKIISELGEHRVYWEPFCGSMAVLLNKPPTVMETANDLHGDLINLARTIQHEDSAVDLFGRMSRTLMHEEVHRKAADAYKSFQNAPAGDSPDVDRAYAYLLSAWMGRNGVAGTQSYNQGYCVRYTASGGHSATRFRSVIDSIPAWFARLQNVSILNRDARDLLSRIEDRAGTVIYCDPPYVEKGAKYIHDFTTDQHGPCLFSGSPSPMSHAELSYMLKRFKSTRVVVSYYDHPMVRELYRGWTFVPCPTTKAMVNQGSRSRGTKNVEVAPEMLIINGPTIGTEGKP